MCKLTSLRVSPFQMCKYADGEWCWTCDSFSENPIPQITPLTTARTPFIKQAMFQVLLLDTNYPILFYRPIYNLSK